MNRLLLLLSVLFPLLCPAQQAEIDTLHWSANRRLQLSDFHAPKQPGLGGSEFYYQIGYDVRPTVIGTLPAIDAYCLMFRNLSWVSETAHNERTLAYNQVLFDLVEIYARQMKAKLIALKADRRFKQQAKQIEYLTNAELGAEVNRFRSETGGGDDLEVLKRWQRQVIQRLYEVPDLVTNFQPAKVGLGLSVGGSTLIPTGNLMQTLPRQVGLLYGVDVAVGRTLLLLNLGLHNTSLRKGFTDQNQEWPYGIHVRSSLIDLGFGRIIYDSPHTRLAPFVGYRLLNLLPRDRKDDRYKGFSLASHMPTAGVIWDLKFGGNISQPDRVEDHFWFVRTKLSVSPVLAPKSLSGGLLNLQISVGGFGRPRRVNYRPERTTIVLPGNLM
ncbi:hypothetical protein [Spirosoma utsteinense]|uniref:Uncharacterized protein n=1 Tax=Spirosoma utsteinense TaxID=2585773 RepID=A0ABR6WCV6_9BACT|nr:hypothetical protein [Spirosoma utsteinense]MBC3786462.1 hypothetical protein [Spirosoma utsteinense]MBC3793825.1 hypothetical protein [Spirosoma utsteinense]